MANVFYRFATAGGDDNVWAQYVLAMERARIGEYKSYLYNDAGTLKISAGRIGINDGTNTGTTEIENTSIALTGTAGIWQKIEMAVSGSTVTFSSADLAGETDPAVLPALFTAGYVAAKMGYYLIATKRCIGVVYVDTNSALNGIINSRDGIYGYYGYCITDDFGAGFGSLGYNLMQWDIAVNKYRQWLIIDVPNWDMDTVPTKTRLHYITDISKVIAIEFIVRNDTESAIYEETANGGGEIWISSFDTTQFILSTNFPGGIFDNVNFDDTTINRVRVLIEMRE